MADTAQIKEGAPGDYKATIEGFEDIDNETAAQLWEFYENLEEIKKRPDAEKTLGQIKAVLSILAGGGNYIVDIRPENEDRQDDAASIFRNFRDATVALLGCDDTPRKVVEVVAKMLDELGYECGGHAEPENEYAYRVISKVFDLDDASGEEEAQSPAPPSADATGYYKEIRAEQFTLVDGDGNTHATLQIAGGGAVLSMRDSKGRTRLRLRAGDDEATIAIYGERGECGKGVLPATDEVERIKIGYESSEQDARIVLQDGNERECVALSIDGEDGGGLLYLTRPCDGGYVNIDNAGLGVYDRNNKTLAEFPTPKSEASDPEKTIRDLMGQVTDSLVAGGGVESLRDALNRSATSPPPRPTSGDATVRNGVENDDWRGRILSEKEASTLANTMFTAISNNEADVVAGVVFKIVDMLAYERDPVVREESFNAVTSAIYSLTRDRDDALTRFAAAAGAKFGRAAAGSWLRPNVRDAE